MLPIQMRTQNRMKQKYFIILMYKFSFLLISFSIFLVFLAFVNSLQNRIMEKPKNSEEKWIVDSFIRLLHIHFFGFDVSFHKTRKIFISFCSFSFALSHMYAFVCFPFPYQTSFSSEGKTNETGTNCYFPLRIFILCL